MPRPSRNPKKGKKPSPRTPSQSPPGIEKEMRPQADHGEQSYEGAGKLKGLAALITGGDSGIGRAVAIAFAREGADVAIGYLAAKEDQDARETARWVEQSGQRTLLHRFDVQEQQACRTFVQKTVRAFGRLEVVVNHAAYQMEQESILDITPAQLEATFRTNIFGYF